LVIERFSKSRTAGGGGSLRLAFFAQVAFKGDVAGVLFGGAFAEGRD
jgi:hypothetical protein